MSSAIAAFALPSSEPPRNSSTNRVSGPAAMTAVKKSSFHIMRFCSTSTALALPLSEPPCSISTSRGIALASGTAAAMSSSSAWIIGQSLW